MTLIHPGRMIILQRGGGKPGPVLFWMSRDQRASDNWSLLFARELAKKNRFQPDRGILSCPGIPQDGRKAVSLYAERTC